MGGVTLKELVQQLLERGIRSPREGTPSTRRAPPPVIIPPRGVTIPAISPEELRQIDEAEDEAKYAGPA